MLALSERSVAVTAAQHAALQPSPKSEFDSAVVKLASFTIHNRSSTHQSFALLGSNPEVVSANGASGGTLRHGVYQASRIVAAKTGSYTFMLPAASPLAWASPLGEHPDVIVVTGRAREAPKDGTKLFISDYALLATKDTERRSCEMTMPVGSEPRFKTEKELGTWGGKSREGMEDGIIDIHVDNTFITHHPDRPFIGIGAPDPQNPHNIIPVCTWDAQPGVLYIIKPRLDTWKIARRSAQPGEIVELQLVPTAQEITFDIQSDSQQAFFQDTNLFVGAALAIMEESSNEVE